MFPLSPDVDLTWITTMGEIEVPPSLIVKRFGPPLPGSDYKIGGEYRFADEHGNAFVVHDFKQTSQFDPTFPTAEEFWALDEPQELCIATRDLETKAFEEWFLREIGWP